TFTLPHLTSSTLFPYTTLFRSDFHEVLAPDLEAIRETAADMLAFRDRIEALRARKCVAAPFGAPFGYFYSILAPETWTKYRKAVESAYLHVQQLSGTSP